MLDKIQIEITTKHSIAFYRKLYLAALIDRKPGVNLKRLEVETGWHRRTIQDCLVGMKSISIQIVYIGTPKKGYYHVQSWGVFSQEAVQSCFHTIGTAIEQKLMES